LKITDKFGFANHVAMTEELFRKLEVRELIDLGAGLNPRHTMRDKLKIRQLLIDLSYPEVEHPNMTRKQFDVMNFDSLASVVAKFSQEVRSKDFKFRGIRLLDVLLSRMLFIHYFPRACFNLYAFRIIK